MNIANGSDTIIEEHTRPKKGVRMCVGFLSLFIYGIHASELGPPEVRIYHQLCAVWSYKYKS